MNILGLGVEKQIAQLDDLGRKLHKVSVRSKIVDMKVYTQLYSGTVISKIFH
jgi:hypothetical protein